MKNFTVIANDKKDDKEAEQFEIIINHIYDKGYDKVKEIKNKVILVSTPQSTNNKMYNSLYDAFYTNSGSEFYLSNQERINELNKEWISFDIESKKEVKDKPKSKHNHWLQPYTKRKHRG